MASTYLSRSTNSGSTGTKWTLSAWVKRAGTGENNCIWNQSNDGNNTTYNEVAIKSANELDVQIRNGTSGDNGTYIRRRTSRVFRDCNAFYHIVVRYDSTDGTAGNRLRLYVNGVEETSMQESVGTVPQNQVTVMATSGATQTFGRGVGGDHYWNGVISHAHLCDGYSYAPSEFGETDSTTGEWKIKVDPSVSYGTNGWWILKDGNSITDSSPNSNAFSLTAGTLTKTEDCPDNVFATLNPLCTGSLITLSEGNLKVTGNSASDSSTTTATMGITSGKFYWEAKIINIVSGYPYLGIYQDFDSLVQGVLEGGATGDRLMTVYIAAGSTTLVKPGTNLTITAPTTNDIIMFAVDKVNNKFYMGVNGTWYNSGDPTSGATGTGSLADLDANGVVMFGSHNYNNSRINCNTGNGYFGTSAVSSAGTNASGNGIFEYDTPTGYTALSTKGLNL